MEIFPTHRPVRAYWNVQGVRFDDTRSLLETLDTGPHGVPAIYHWHHRQPFWPRDVAVGTAVGLAAAGVGTLTAAFLPGVALVQTAVTLAGAGALLGALLGPLVVRNGYVAEGVLCREQGHMVFYVDGQLKYRYDLHDM